ncbi:MAG TPA: hypothetical protein EYQ14_14390 [Gammaproteobacteria bacterium]|nr:hypothetical protein [Gammaproteobacteria bacterium]HIL95679.1 hypothetical protein [Pseudomonadales bacterium]
MNFSQHYLEDRLAILLGGRAAENLVFQEVSSGAANDLKEATHLARHMISEWGMNENLGPITFSESEQNFLGREFTPSREISDHTAEMIDDEVAKLIQTSENRAIEV